MGSEPPALPPGHHSLTAASGARLQLNETASGENVENRELPTRRLWRPHHRAQSFMRDGRGTLRAGHGDGRARAAECTMFIQSCARHRVCGCGDAPLVNRGGGEIGQLIRAGTIVRRKRTTIGAPVVALRFLSQGGGISAPLWKGTAVWRTLTTTVAAAFTFRFSAAGGGPAFFPRRAPPSATRPPQPGRQLFLPTGRRQGRRTQVQPTGLATRRPHITTTVSDSAPGSTLAETATRRSRAAGGGTRKQRPAGTTGI